jgi:hypothetical protein
MKVSLSSNNSRAYSNITQLQLSPAHQYNIIVLQQRAVVVTLGNAL